MTRYLKGEDTNVNLLYLGAVSSIGAMFLCLVIPDSLQKPGSSLVAWLLLANGENLDRQVHDAFLYSLPMLLRIGRLQGSS